jgi:hypothetical protein
MYSYFNGGNFTNDQSEKQPFWSTLNKIGDVVFGGVLRAPDIFIEIRVKKMIVS